MADCRLVLPEDAQLLVFDLDGTLYNKHLLPLYLIWACRSSLSLLKAERKARKQLKGVYCGSQEAFYSRLFKAMAEACGTTTEHTAKWYNETYMPAMVSALQNHYTADAFLMSQLSEWRQQGKRLVVYSDYGETAAKLQAIGLDCALFDAVLDAPSLGGLKPAVQGMESILKQFDVTPTQAVMIGDRPDTDGELAARAGVRYIQYKAK